MDGDAAETQRAMMRRLIGFALAAVLVGCAHKASSTDTGNDGQTAATQPPIVEPTTAANATSLVGSWVIDEPVGPGKYTSATFGALAKNKMPDDTIGNLDMALHNRNNDPIMQHYSWRILGNGNLMLVGRDSTTSHMPTICAAQITGSTMMIQCGDFITKMRRAYLLIAFRLSSAAIGVFAIIISAVPALAWPTYHGQPLHTIPGVLLTYSNGNHAGGITIRTAHGPMPFSTAQRTTWNGKIISCVMPPSQVTPCRDWPKRIVPGHTTVVVTYWSGINDGPGIPGSVNVVKNISAP